MGLFDFLKKEQPQPEERKLVKEDFKVVGVHYHPAEIKRLQNANPDWRKGGKTLAEEGKVNKRIYHYSYINKPVKIAVDDGSVYKKGALKVIIAGEFVGYIPDDDTKHVSEILKTKSVKYVTAMIKGGEYKVIGEDGKPIKCFIKDDDSKPFVWEDEIKISLRIAYA